MGKKAYLSMMAQENQVQHVDAPVLPFCHHALTPTRLPYGQVIKDTDAADARYCGGAMTGGTGWVCW